jgi:hypothetical protein
VKARGSQQDTRRLCEMGLELLCLRNELLTFLPQTSGIFLSRSLSSSSHIQLSGLDCVIEGRLATRCSNKRLSGLWCRVSEINR